MRARMSGTVSIKGVSYVSKLSSGACLRHAAKNGGMAAATRGRLTSRSLKWKPHRKDGWPRPRVAAIFLLALLAVLVGGAALRESVAIDELAHIGGAGVSYWQRLDLR